MNKTSKNIIKYLIEIIIVSFGVFLGVFFSNVNDGKKVKKEKEKALNLIISELELNKQLTNKYVDYHEKIKNEIDSILPSLSDKDKFSNISESNFKQNNLKSWNGFQYARLEKTAFESVKVTGIIKEFDIVLTQKISNVYYLQDTYTDAGNLILNKAINLNSHSKALDLIQSIKLLTTDLLSLEKQISKKLEETIIELHKITKS